MKTKVYVELGCGSSPITENTPDISHRKISYRLDVQRLPHVNVSGLSTSLPFLDESINGFVSQHLIEHHSHQTFDRDFSNGWGGDLLRHLQEVYRCLKPKGFYETMCPNFAHIAQAYCINGFNDTARALQYMQWAMGGQRNEFDYYFVLLDLNILGHFATLAGFDSCELADPENHPFNWFGLHAIMSKR